MDVPHKLSLLSQSQTEGDRRVSPAKHTQKRLEKLMISMSALNKSGLIEKEKEQRISVRCTKNTSPDKTKTCETTKEQLTPQLTPKPQKQGEIDTKNLPPDLAESRCV